MKLFVDTNVFLRFLLNDNKTQSVSSRKLFFGAKRGKVTLVTNSLIIAEIIFILDSYYGFSKSDIIEKTKIILLFDGLEIPEKNILLHAISLFEKKNIDFVDAYVAAFALENKIDVCSFDRDFDKIKEIKRINPSI